MSRWNITENITEEVENQISPAMALSRNIEEVHMAVLNICQYEVVPIPEFPGTARYISASQGMGKNSCCGVFTAPF